MVRLRKNMQQGKEDFKDKKGTKKKRKMNHRNKKIKIMREETENRYQIRN